MRFDYILRTEGTVLQLHDAEWALDIDFAKGEVVLDGTMTFWCRKQHTSAANNEPGVGAQWETYWGYLCIAVGAGGITLHSLLSGLAADDHPQYLKADGSRALSAALILAQIATPAAPANGYTKLYAKADGKIYKRAYGGAEAEISHVQGTDLGLDAGGSNPVTAAQLRLVLAKANRNTDQSIPSGTVTVIAYNNELVDTHSAFNPATGVFTVPVAGYYRVTTMTRFASKAFAAGDELSTGVLVNGGEEGKTFGTFMPASFTASYLCGGSYITTWLAVNATIQAAVYSTGAIVVDGDPFAVFCSIVIERITGA